MLTKSDFQQAILDSLPGYPTIAALYQAGDPRLLQHLSAMAAMLALVSAQIETAMTEPFEKSRDATVLADAALKGILRQASPARFQISAKNDNPTPFTIGAGVGLLDSNGRPCRVDTPVTIPAGGTATFEALQINTTTITHTVSGSAPFYQIEIPAPYTGYFSGIAVASGSIPFSYAQKFTNIAAGDKVFHVETDEYQRMFVRFGYGGVVGYQPADGEVITIQVSSCEGDVRPEVGSPFSFEYLYTPQYSLITLTLTALVTPGEDPPDITTLRDLCRYPSVYDESAVYLGEFDFVIRRNLPSLAFLSVWNETVEEGVRGPSVDHINTLFIACMLADGTEAVLDEPDPTTPVAPTVIPRASWTGTQQQIAHIVAIADDSYRVRFYTPVRSKIAITVAAVVSSSYDTAAVQAQIETALLAEYGITTQAAQHGALNPLYQHIYVLLPQQVPALADQASDWTVAISPPPTPVRPEHWRYVAADSLTVTVMARNTVPGSWGGI